MPNWNGLGYTQLAGQLSSQRADRAQSYFQQVLDMWAKRLDTMQAQGYESGTKMPLQQQYAMEQQGASDKSALERLMMELQSREGMQEGEQTFTGAENEKNRQFQAGQSGLYDQTAKEKNALGWAGVNKKEDQTKTSILDFLTEAAYFSGQGVGPTGVWGGFNSIKDDETGTRADKIKALRDAFVTATDGDPNQAKYLAAFDRQAGYGGGTSSGVSGPSPSGTSNQKKTDTSVDFANSIKKLLNTYDSKLTSQEKKTLNDMYISVYPSSRASGGWKPFNQAEYDKYMKIYTEIFNRVNTGKR